MKSTTFFLFMLVSYELCGSVTISKGKQSNLIRNKNGSRGNSKQTNQREYSGITSSNGDSGNKNYRIPQTDFYSSFPNALGFTGMGFLWIRELSAAVGTPLAIFIMALPMLISGIGFLFIPDFTKTGIPIFYPGGGSSSDSDASSSPSPSQPSLPDLDDIINSDFIKQATQLLPPGLLPSLEKNDWKRNS